MIILDGLLLCQTSWTGLCGRQIDNAVIQRDHSRRAITKSLQTLTRKADRVWVHTDRILKNIRSNLNMDMIRLIITEDLGEPRPCDDYIQYTRIRNQSISQVEVLESHISILIEARQVIMSLEDFDLRHQLKTLENLYIKSLICETAKVLHVLAIPLPIASVNTVSLCPVSDRYGLFLRTYRLLHRLRRLAETIYGQYTLMSADNLLQNDAM